MSIMDDQNSSYAPRSPDLSAYHSSMPAPPVAAPPPQQSYYTPSDHSQQPLHSPAFQQSYTIQQNTPISPYGNAPHLKYEPPTSNSAFNTASLVQAQKHRRPANEMDEDWGPSEPAKRGRKPKKPKVEEVDYGDKPAPGVEEGIEVKTKFPVARIKRIMQADEDVGKVAQVTPTAVSKALELFMISLVTKSAAHARAKNSKKITAAHLKHIIQQDEQFDFLSDAVAKVPDAPAPKKDEDSEGHGEGKKRRGAPRKKRADADDD